MTTEAVRSAAVLGYNFPGSEWYADAYKLVKDKAPAQQPAPAGLSALPTQTAQGASPVQAR